ncbi:heat repeat-containing protein : HEAT repeat-containing protein OS=Leptolyngbya sp. PCC 7375 GN=Lepto7375DRAFT_2567 PE=4 SV=1: HEAT_2: HEAT_2: HEAT_2 [Gemmata massiliana]|uniref:Lyase n=1 Tax=Gemmata massiliana TaxID=1210884 RepID=A0A6P2D9Y9_9BACT|nr:HEAT repeat domain-containing protein [Gemmata massiliana]VTR97175.1 heat repeat-containing protein : HEAT repeat-containing protein OS=Leptolyngbya sp. PCC 7375 GN=Lepto7375DRAFT_2567 PE=4 SV=1: HEAT_2: HEAT_2: HEAT_2 [Gemmata massiliana]
MTTTILLLVVPLTGSPLEVSDDPAIFSWVADLGGADIGKQFAARAALVKAGPKAKSAVPLLVKQLGDKNARRHAIEVLGAIGPSAKDAVPALIAQLPSEDGIGYGAEQIAIAITAIDGPKPEATRALVLTSAKGGEIMVLHSDTLHQHPAEVVPHVIALCGDKNARVRARAATALGELKRNPDRKEVTLFDKAGTKATKGIPAALDKLLTDESAEVRLSACLAISRTEERPEKVIPVVVAVALDDKNERLLDLARAPEIFRPVPKQAATALVPLFGHKSDRLRRWAVETLAHLPVREQMEGALQARAAHTRLGAALVLGSYRFDDGNPTPALKAALADPEFAVRFAATKGVYRYVYKSDPELIRAVPILIEGLQQKEEQVQIDACQILTSLGPPAKGAAPALKKLIEYRLPRVSFEAALALVAVTPKDAKDAIPVLAKALGAGPDSSARWAAKALGDLGADAKPALPELIRKFDANDAHLRVAAADAVIRIDPTQAPKAIEVITELLKDRKNLRSGVHEYSLKALVRVGAPAKVAMPALAQVLTDKDALFRGDVALAMITIDAENATTAYDWVRKILDDSAPDRDDVREQLPTLGKLAEPLVPDLIAQLKSEIGHNRQYAIETLGAVGPGAKEALPALKKLVEADPEMSNRKCAAEAVKKIEKK